MDQFPEASGPGYRIWDDNGNIVVSCSPGLSINKSLLMEILTREIEFLRGLGKNDLWDLRDCTIDPDVNSESIRDIVLFLKGNNVRQFTAGKTALVVNSDLVYGLTRIFQEIADVKGIGYEIEVFRNKEDALAWLLQPGGVDEMIDRQPVKRR